MTSGMEDHKVVSREEWIEARLELMGEEKALTQLRDAVSRRRRLLSWVKVEKEYTFETPQGKRTLAGLFAERSQLIVYHFMWRRELGTGCVGSSFLCDHVDGANQHLAQHDVTFVAVSRAPLGDLMQFHQRMGWKFDWVSSQGSDFHFDYHVSFRPEELARGEVYYNFRKTKASIEELSGISVFYRAEDGTIYHTYSSYGRGNEEVVGAYMWLDLTPKGRNETGPTFTLADWVRHHDRYGSEGYVDATGGYVAEPRAKSPCGCKKMTESSASR